MNATLPGYSGSADELVPAPAQALRRGGRAALRQALLAMRRDTLSLARQFEAALGPAMQVPRAATLNPPRWELGHVAWFQQWWIARNPHRDRGPGADPLQPRPPSDLPQADAWYDSSAVAHATRWDLPLPPLQDTLDWLAATQAQTLSLLDALPEAAGDDELYFFRLACLHEAMHVEAARYMAHALDIPVPLPSAPAANGHATTLRIPAQAWLAGWQGAGFAFDNELPALAVDLPAFEIDAQPLSWSRFGAFVAGGGYGSARWWTPEGWAWRQARRPDRPAFPANDAPACHLSAHEADAFCRWAGRRLPSEAEWECAALTEPGLAWGSVWEWTASPFQPHPGFVPHPYRDYSQPWFGQRRVLRGASVATPACLAHPRFRNFFEPQRTDIFAGFRTCA